MKTRSLILLITIVFLFSACSTFSSPKETSSTDQSAGISEQSEGMEPSFTKDNFGSNNLEQPSISNEKLIQNIGLELETKDYTKTVEAIEALVKSLNGYIQNSYIPLPRNESEFSNLVANLSVMIPTSSIEDFILNAGKTSKIVSERREVYNVTDVYRDTEARIVTLQAKELRLLELLKQSGSLSDLLLIENELSNTRYEIERLESSIQDYDKRIAYTQFNLSIREVYEYSPSERAGLWERIVEAFSSNAQSFIRTLENGFVFIVSTLPFLLVEVALWTLPIMFFYFVYRKVTKKHNVTFWFKNRITNRIKTSSKDDSSKKNE
ncbi:MAG TPA: hypothetical protein DIC19_03010 [Erysipelotrichaceae bacterium]|nr:hypothetical protein [Erysipelotrichaceae bacterium]